jgi:AraC-like DNA-binding protein
MRPHVIHGDPAGDFFFAVGAPDPRLGHLVRSYGDYHERTDAPLRRLEVPGGDIPVIVDFGDGWLVGQGDTEPVRMGSFAGGLHDGPAIAEHGGRARCMQIDLSPLGARTLLGVPPGELAHQVVALEDLLGADAARLADALDAAGTWTARFHLLDRLLLERVAATTAELRPDVAHAHRRLTETAGALPIEQLRRELGCSRRHLSARFREEIGLTPKAFARVLRFGRTISLIDRGAGLADVAHACGYADQAHFTREFRTLSGRTPTEFLAARLDQSAGYAAA